LNNESIYDRYLLIPVLGVAILLDRILNFLTLARDRYLKAYLMVVLGVITVFTLLTGSYIPSFNNDIAVTKNTYEKFPEWDGSSFNYVYSLIEGHRFDEAYAITMKEKTFASPLWVRSYFVGWIFLERGMVDEAISELKTSAYHAMSGGYFPFPAIPSRIIAGGFGVPHLSAP
jgi:hypothetical protein